MFKAEDFFVLSDSFSFRNIFSLEEAPWLWLPKISEALSEFNFSPYEGEVPKGFLIKGPVFIDPSVQLPAFGSIEGPCYIGKNTQIRPGVYIRGNVIVGDSCVLGNSCEFKNCLILEGAQIPHFSYVGDSLIGNKAHLGAGVICSNLRLDQESVKIHSLDGERIETHLRKLGAIVGDYAEVGCNTVLNPGSLLLPNSCVYPSVDFKGTLDSHTIACNESKFKRIRIKPKH